MPITSDPSKESIKRIHLQADFADGKTKQPRDRLIKAILAAVITYKMPRP